MKHPLLLAALFMPFGLAAQPGFKRTGKELSIPAKGGLPDSSFGTFGYTVPAFNMPAVSAGNAVMYNDKLVVGAAGEYSGNTKAVVAAFLSGGGIDPSFGTGGRVILDYNTNLVDDEVQTLMVQADGKVVVALTHEFSTRFLRLNVNGTIDAGFGGSAGFVLAGSNFNTVKILPYPDGKLIVLGYSNIAGQSLLLKLKSTGVPDSSFGTDGLAVIGGRDVFVEDMAMQTDQRIVVVGGLRNEMSNDPPAATIARFKTDGLIDSSFGGAGFVQPATPFGKEYSLASVVIQPDGKILAGGSVHNRIGAMISEGGVFVRYLSNGTPDASFGTDGISRVLSGGNLILPGVLALQTDGKILTAGSFRNGADYEFAMIRLLSNGSPDATYDGDGVARLNIGHGYDQGYIPVLQSDGKALLLGTALIGNRSVFTAARFQTSGAQDAAYNGSGLLTLTLGEGEAGNQNSSFYQTDVLPDGKILALGDYFNGLNMGAFVARFQSDGTLDPAYGSSGYTGLWIGGFDQIKWLKALPGGGAIIGGTTNDEILGYQLVLVKLNAAGNPDPTFGIGGKMYLEQTTPASMDIYDMITQADGSIFLSVISFDLTTYDQYYYIYKLNASGTPDPGFDGDGRKDISYPVYCLALQPDGKLVTSGTGLGPNPAEGENVLTARYLTNGAPDLSFNGGNAVSTNFSDFQDNVIGLSVLPGGRILLACKPMYLGPTPEKMGIIVLKPNGLPDSTYSGDGKHEITPGFMAQLMKIAPDSSFYFSSNNYLGYTLELAVSRIRLSGLPDSSFGNSGTGTLLFRKAPESKNVMYGISFQSDGKALMAGNLMEPGYIFTKPMLLRLSPPLGNYPVRLTFTGTGNWSSGANWAGGTVPPNPLPAGTEIIIDHSTGGYCLLDVPITVLPGARIVVTAGSTFRAAADITLPSVTSE